MGIPPPVSFNTGKAKQRLGATGTILEQLETVDFSRLNS